jgi:hypothetical protein
VNHGVLAFLHPEQVEVEIWRADELEVRRGLSSELDEMWSFVQAKAGLDHGVGHSLLLLYDVKAPIDQKNNEFKALGHYPSNTSLSTF